MENQLVEAVARPDCSVLFKFHRGEVFSSRKCLKPAQMIHGRTGWRVVGDSTVPVLQMVFCDAKGNSHAEWVDLSEFKRRKAERSKVWKKTQGPIDWRNRRKRFALREAHGACFPELIVHDICRPYASA